jgi:hypothetical protein
MAMAELPDFFKFLNSISIQNVAKNNNIKK